MLLHCHGLEICKKQVFFPESRVVLLGDSSLLRRIPASVDMITSSVQSQKQFNLLSYLLPDQTNLYKQIVTGDSKSSELDALDLTCILQRDISSLSDSLCESHHFGETTKVGVELHLLVSNIIPLY